MNFYSKISLIALLAIGQAQAYTAVLAAFVPFFNNGQVTVAQLPKFPEIPTPNFGIGDRVDNISDSLDRAAASIHYVGFWGAPAVNRLSNSINDLVYKGILSAGICATGVITAACGLGIITHTLLNDKAAKKPMKYTIGAGLAAIGIATVLCSNWLSGLRK